MRIKHFVMLILTWFSVMMFLASCSPQRRFNRLIKKHPELIQTDTITRIDTVVVTVPRVQHDTSFIETALHDTVYIEKDRLSVKLWKVYDTIHVDAECDTVTVTEYIETKIPVKYYENKKSNLWIIILLIVLFATYIFVTNKNR